MLSRCFLLRCVIADTHREAESIRNEAGGRSEECVYITVSGPLSGRPLRHFGKCQCEATVGLAWQDLQCAQVFESLCVNPRDGEIAAAVDERFSALQAGHEPLRAEGGSEGSNFQERQRELIERIDLVVQAKVEAQQTAKTCWRELDIGAPSKYGSAWQSLSSTILILGVYVR